MGIESDQVVYEYLSRVGDVAHQRQLSSATRMRLVSELRNEIDRRRAKSAVDSPAAVRRILDRLGTPDEVVAAAGDGGPRQPGEAPTSVVPVQREPEAEERPKGLRRAVPRPRPARPAAPPPAAGTSVPPHLATADQLGAAAGPGADWWRTDGSPFGIGDDVPGFVGGVEIPDLLKPPSKEPPRQPDTVLAPAAEAEPEAVDDVAAPRRRPGLAAALRPGRWSNPLLLLAAALLVVGAVLGNWFALLLGWVIAYASRRLTPTESKWAVMGMPGLALAAGVVWLWGRTDARWGTPIAQGHMNDAVAQTWPWVVRAAAVLSALFLVWRSQRQR
ncbi:hypothetical protein [Streptomyces naganishii]|uniref:Membrane protein n=1 Tax=Streptomyces naganishii JCM 4654 TaxID=1306179 RepID=A0A918Y565_9ACTN|nr:hypothetical protein [Streptomyces naganishii]GHD91402.1 membrane protein [Streptomyces naganishii JCM 4654]